ncbi:MAG: tetratricopeptide repeat protein [Planctomycetales bacterium]|nr:tetratricopeptide repeat protein [Planctomycetales bacterium]
MKSEEATRPALEALYHRFLETENSAAFVRAVAHRYTLPTLCRLADYGECISRRAAVLAISFLGDYRQNAALGAALQDRDRGVRMLADNGIRELWRRQGSIAEQKQLGLLSRLNSSGLYADCLTAAGEFIEASPWIAEGWNQRAIAHFAQEHFEDAANDCHQTLELNAYHFGAAVGMGHCYLELDEPFAALECFRRALNLNPDLEEVRVQVDYIQRQLEGKE